MKKFLLSLALVLLSGAAMAQSVTYQLSATTYSAEQLNALTEATMIAVKNISGTNGYYLAANANIAEFGYEAVLVWEPAEENTPGKYHLRRLSAGDNGYIQAVTSGAVTAVTLGAKATAQVFEAVTPNAPAGETLNSDNNGILVRFKQYGVNTWLNCQAAASTPVLCHTGQGGWTMHNVYGVNVETAAAMTDAEKAAAKAEAQAIPTGSVGYPKSSAIQAFCDAVDAATYATEVVALKEEMLANVENFVMPAADKVYALDSYKQYIYNNVNGSTDLKTNGNSNTDTKALWKFIPVDGGYNIQNVHTGLYINGAVMSETPGLFTLDVVAVEEGTTHNAQMGQFYIKINGGDNCIHSTAENAKSWGGAGLGNQYKFEEVNEFSHTLSVTDAGWATLVLGFNATIPANVKAYTIESEEGNYVTLADATGVLKANVPVIVEATEGNYDFAYTTEPATVETSGLEGTLYNKNIAENAYVLGIPEGETEVGLAMAKLTDGAFLNNANKAYYVPSTANGITAYSFRFGGNATAIESVKSELDLNAPIYDLSGRLVVNAVKGGLYIQNGKKFIVK